MASSVRIQASLGGGRVAVGVVGGLLGARGILRVVGSLAMIVSWSVLGF
ncbi:MAG: hypothetical protein GSR80_000967 [Desulfurococcales archaeon]|nr:hypothetical protein [Desulfurococcales archaeon]